MFPRSHANSLGGTALVAILLSCQTTLGQEPKPVPDRPTPSSPDKDQIPEKGYTILAKGPVHEAYAQPYKKDPQPTPVVPRKPPGPVPEEPPDQKPQGENVQWIPGYWTWDSDKQDYIWVSGFWRVPPPGRQWTPGYWTEAEGGWRWVPGYWADARPDVSGIVPAEVDYLPEPPGSLDYGPSVPAPDDDSTYVPGNWVYRSSRYLWRPGFWTTGYDDWVWNPPYYSWTPAGSVYVNGYWDYPLADRGLLFAPVYFNEPLWNNPGWFYQPKCVFGVGGLLSALFCRPAWCSYYYGNYYSPFYAGLGFQPWCNYGWGGFGFDPLFNHYGWANRFHPGWAGGLRNDFLARRNGILPGPANTLAQQAAFAGQVNGNRFPRTVTPLNQFQSNTKPLARLNQGQLAQHAAGTQHFRTLANQRLQAEKAVASGTRAPRQGFQTGSSRQSQIPGAGGNLGSARASRAGTPSQGRSFANSRASQSGIPSPGQRFGNGSVSRNGSPLDGRSYQSPTGSSGYRPGTANGTPRQSLYRRGGVRDLQSQGFSLPRNYSNGARSSPSARNPARGEGAPGAHAPQRLQGSPTRNYGSTSRGGSPYHGSSFSHPAPAFRGGSPRVRSGGTSSFHGGASSFHGGGGSGHISGGGHSSGGHGGGGHGGSEHHR